MRQQTLDIIDASLREEFGRYTGHTPTDRWKLFARTVQVDPVRWTEFEAYFAGQQLVWNEFKYEDAVQANDLRNRIQSDSPGLYVFFVRPNTLISGFSRLPQYVGISGDNNSVRPLRERLQEYFRLSTITKRKNVHQMLQMYYPYTWVSYTLLDWNTNDLKELETKMHEYLGIEFATQAYTPTTKAARSAWPRN
jgi:hypothetical protein